MVENNAYAASVQYSAECCSDTREQFYAKLCSTRLLVFLVDIEKLKNIIFTAYNIIFRSIISFNDQKTRLLVALLKILD